MVVDPVPAFEDLHERVLHQLFGFMAVADDEVQGAVEARVLFGEEVFEAEPFGRYVRVDLLESRFVPSGVWTPEPPLPWRC